MQAQINESRKVQSNESWLEKTIYIIKSAKFCLKGYILANTESITHALFLENFGI